MEWVKLLLFKIWFNSHLLVLHFLLFHDQVKVILSHFIVGVKEVFGKVQSHDVGHAAWRVNVVIVIGVGQIFLENLGEMVVKLCLILDSYADGFINYAAPIVRIKI